MKDGIHGSVATLEVQVTDEMTATLEGVSIHKVYSTFWLAYHAEVAARRALEPWFSDGENAVGSAITLRHIGMTPVGATVVITATVVEVRKNRVVCAIAATNKHTLVAEGMQEQTVLPASVLERRVAEVNASQRSSE